MAKIDYGQGMDEETAKGIAKLLRKPEGEYAIEVGEKMNEGNRYINHRTIGLIPIKTKDRLLEIGMGNGFFVKDIFDRDRSIQYMGCDYSQEMVDQACILNSELIKSGSVEFHLAEANQLPVGDETIDHVFTINTVYFWEDHVKVLTEIKRVLKAKGTLTLSLRPKASMATYAFTKYGFDMFSKDDLADLLERNGFKVISSLEEQEPEQEIDGSKTKVETLILCTEKTSHE